MTIIIKIGIESVTYSVEVNELIPESRNYRTADPKMRGYINEYLEKILDEAVVLIHHSRGSKSFIIEDSSGIYAADIKGCIGRFVIDDSGSYYTKSYNEVIRTFENPNKYISSSAFYSRIAKSEEKYSLKSAIQYLRMNPWEFMFKEHAKEDNTGPVISVSAPDIMRKTGNENRYTFDFVAVELLLRHDLDIKDMDAFVKENIELFNKLALDKIAGSKKYQSFDVPVEYLKLYSVGNHSKSILRMFYELKRMN